jgi:hypothetical protein
MDMFVVPVVVVLWAVLVVMRHRLFCTVQQKVRMRPVPLVVPVVTVQ